MTTKTITTYSSKGYTFSRKNYAIYITPTGGFGGDVAADTGAPVTVINFGQVVNYGTIKQTVGVRPRTA